MVSVIHVLIGHSYVFFGKVSFQVLAHFYCTIYHVIELYEFFKYSDPNPMSDTCIVNIFLLVCVLTFQSLNGFF